MPMTPELRARVEARMQETGEPFGVALRAIGAEDEHPADAQSLILPEVGSS